MKLRRPILVGGLGLSFSLWMLDSLQDSLVQVGEFGLLSLLAVGGGLWLFQKNRPKDSTQLLNGMPVDRETVEVAIAKTQSVVNQLTQEAEDSVEKRRIASLQQEQVANLTAELDRQQILATVTGGKLVGKTTLIEVLEQSVETGYQ